ncbi:MAG: FkbM family methyltransferase [Opitutae bacterium]|nr:FkbM family methyltransferase [Opitutae bacterium]
MPSGLNFLWWRLSHPQRDRLRREIIAHAEASGLSGRDPEVREAVDFLRSHKLHVFPYPFVADYHPADHPALFDDAAGLHYVDHGGKKLYWRADRKPKRIPGDYAALLAEQDERSPHRYLVPGFDVKPGDIVADVGCAEGNFSLEIVERAAHVYLFEADGRWAKALETTFRPWKDKVTISRSLVGKQSGDGMVALDDFFADKPAPTFLKLDVEGYEADVLNGARQTIARARDVRAAVCTYHRQEDEAALAALLRELGFTPAASRGYMLLYREASFGPPYFRRGLLRATKP